MDPSARLVGLIPVRDALAAREFYAGRLGMQFVQDDGFALVFRCNGSMVRLFHVGADFVPAAHTVCGWEVPDLGTTVEELKRAGVVMERYPFADGEIWKAPGGNYVAWFKDPDGNVLSVSQHEAGMDLGL